MGETVLVVHERREARARLMAALEAAGVVVLEATPEAAGAAVLGERPGVVVTAAALSLPRNGRGPTVIGWGADPGAGAHDTVPADAPAAEIARRVLVHLEHRGARARERAEEARQRATLARAQARLLPRPGSVPGLRFGAVYAPALEAGGDFYDVVRLDHSSYGVLVADTMGHDLGAAYVTGALKAGLHLAVEGHGRPSAVLGSLNGALRPLLADGGHVTAAYARVDRYRSRVLLASAGHPPAILVGADRRARVVESEGDVLGVFEAPVMGEVELAVGPGTRFYLYSDGLLDAYGPGAAARSRALGALCRALEDVAGYPVELAVAEAAARALGGSVPRDDVVLVGLEV
ncbi:PP2C family protein-serine/threonine phosphatase [Deferrisoma sp.]